MRKFRTSVEGGDSRIRTTAGRAKMGRCVNCHLLDKDLVLARKVLQHPSQLGHIFGIPDPPYRFLGRLGEPDTQDISPCHPPTDAAPSNRLMIHKEIRDKIPLRSPSREEESWNLPLQRGPR